MPVRKRRKPPAKTRIRDVQSLMELENDVYYKVRICGVKQAEIADQLNFGIRYIQKLLAKADIRIQGEMRETIGRASAILQVATLQKVQQEAMQAWERSKNFKKKNTVKDRKVLNELAGLAIESSVGHRETSKEEQESWGDKGYLQIAIQASDKIVELLGLKEENVGDLIRSDPKADEIHPDELTKLDPEDIIRRYFQVVKAGVELEKR